MLDWDPTQKTERKRYLRKESGSTLSRSSCAVSDSTITAAWGVRCIVRVEARSRAIKYPAHIDGRTSIGADCLEDIGQRGAFVLRRSGPPNLEQQDDARMLPALARLDLCRRLPLRAYRRPRMATDVAARRWPVGQAILRFARALPISRASSDSPAAAAHHAPGMALSPVAPISAVLIAGVKPPKIAVARL